MAVCVNIERMFAVIFPLKTVGWKKHMIPVSLATAFIYNLPKFFELKVEEFEGSVAGKRIVTTELRYFRIKF
jgi:hypothetical protein